MGFTVELKATPWRHPESGPSRDYRVKWDGTGNTSTALAKNAVISYLYNVVEDLTTGAIRDLTVSPHGTPETPGALEATESRTRYNLHGFPIQAIDCDEIGGTNGKYYEATVRYGVYDNNAQAPAPTGVISTITGEDSLATVDVSRSFSASVRPREIDYAPIVGLLQRTPTTSTSEPAYACPFPIGAINAERTSLGGRIAINGLRINAPSVDYTVSMTITGSYPTAAFVRAAGDAANEGTTNTDSFMLGGITYSPKELLLVSVEFEASYNTTTRIEDGDYDFDSSQVGRMTLGFATGKRKSLIVTSTSGTGYNQLFKSQLAEFIHTPSGGSAPQFYWKDPVTPTTATVGSDQVLYIGPHDYVWRFANDTVSGDSVTSEIEWVSIHSPFPATSFTTLFGSTSL